MTQTLRAAVASPHHVASASGAAILAAGGNAIDAAIATNLTLGVVAPYLCGYGGDLFAMVWDGATVHGYNGSGRAPALATPDAARAAIGSDEMPRIGPHTVTVPGAARGWFDLLERFGTMSFGTVAADALRYASEGFIPSPLGAVMLARAGFEDPVWRAIYADARPGKPFVQADLARTIGALASDGPDAFYGGAIGASIVGHLESLGALMRVSDLAGHRGDWVEPIRAPFRSSTIAQMPPNTQGITALEMLALYEEINDDDLHAMIEAAKFALADREQFVGETASRDLLDPSWIKARAAAYDLARAVDPGVATPAPGGTAYLCAADADGMMVSLIQSNYAGFGSGVTVPGWGINLHNRGTYFRLDSDHVNAIGPNRRTMHTLIPAMALRDDGTPWLAFGTMGGDGQPQTHLQLLNALHAPGRRPSLQGAIDAPRWVVSVGEWAVTIEERFGVEAIEDLRARGHQVRLTGPLDALMGHAHAIEQVRDGAYRAGTDPRAEGAVIGLDEEGNGPTRVES